MGRNKDFSIDLKMRIFQVYKQKEGGYKKLGKRFDVGHSSVANIIQTCLKKESQGLDPFEVVRQGRKKITSVTIQVRRNSKCDCIHVIASNFHLVVA